MVTWKKVALCQYSIIQVASGELSKKASRVANFNSERYLINLQLRSTDRYFPILNTFVSVEITLINSRVLFIIFGNKRESELIYQMYINLATAHRKIGKFQVSITNKRYFSI